MTKDLRQHRLGIDVGSLWRDDRASCVFVQIGAADAANDRLDEDLVGFEFAAGRSDVLDADVTFGVKSYSLHFGLPAVAQQQVDPAVPSKAPTSVAPTTSVRGALTVYFPQFPTKSSFFHFNALNDMR